jgi:putative phosphoribosyl transferase
VPVAVPVARALGCPVDVLVVRKVGLPEQPELAMGAVASANITIRNEDVMAMCPGAERDFERVAARERAEVKRRERAYRGKRAPPALAGLTAVLVDDGIATGATIRAAVAAARRLGAARIVVAVPVAAAESVRMLAREADEVICLQQPAYFTAVGQWYRAFPQVSDAEVHALLAGSGT